MLNYQLLVASGGNKNGLRIQEPVPNKMEQTHAKKNDLSTLRAISRNQEKKNMGKTKTHQPKQVIYNYFNTLMVCVNLVCRRANGGVRLSAWLFKRSSLSDIFSSRLHVSIVAGIVAKTGRFAPCLNSFKNWAWLLEKIVFICLF